MPGAARISCRPLSSQRKGSAKRSRCSVTGCAAGGGGAGGSAGRAPRRGGGGGGGAGRGGGGCGGGEGGGGGGRGCRWMGGRLRSRVGRCGGHAGRRSMVWRMGWRETDACTVSQPQPLRH